MKRFQLILILLSLAFLILAILVKISPFLPWDLVITKAVQSINSPVFDWLMKFLTFLGNQPEELILSVIIVTGLLIGKQKKEAIFVIFSTTGAVIISETLKKIVARPRPDNLLVNQVGQFLNHDSFPSGHVLFYIGLFGYLFFLSYSCLKPGLLRSFLMSILILMIVLIGVSRIYLGAHWFSDVLGSYLIGTIWLLLIVHLHHRLKVSSR